MPIMTRDKSSDLPEADRDWFGGRRWTGIAAIAVIILIALCALVLFLLHRHSSSIGSPAPRTTAASGPASSRPSVRPTSASPLPTTPPTDTPAGTTWSIYQTVALPSIAGQGPAHVNGAIATGYARTPIGALLAAVNEGDRYLLASDSEWRAAAAAMLDTSVPGYQAWLKVRSTHPYGKQGAAGSGQFSQVAGFQFVSYTPSDAVIQIVTRNSDGTYQVVSEHVTWVSADWRFVTAADGSNGANSQQVSDLTGFIQWRGV
jgi:hypothetical protein